MPSARNVQEVDGWGHNGAILSGRPALANLTIFTEMERLTRQHQAILDVLVSADHPLLAPEILALAAQKVPQLSLATVYRNVKSLQDEGTIKAVMLPGENPRYELATRSHHHHFQCRQCARVFDLDACPGNLDRLAPAGFVVEDHEIILYGRCSACSEKPAHRNMAQG